MPNNTPSPASPTPAERPTLEILFQDMYEHTKGECASCRCPHTCCDDMYCALAAEYAYKAYGVELIPLTLEPDTPRFLGPKGCTVAPHNRPLCTLHTCQVNALGYRMKGDGLDEAWNDRYYQLRSDIERNLD